MARENQGLQIALIVLIVLFLLMSVMAFFFYKQAEEAGNKAEQTASELSDTEQSLSTQTDTKNKLMSWIGFGPEMELAAMEEDFKGKMETYAKSLGSDNEENPTYNGTLQAMNTVMENLNAKNKQLETQMANYSLRLERLEEINEIEMQKFKDQADQAEATLKTERERFEQDRQESIAKINQLNAMMESVRSDADSKVATTNAEMASLSSKNADIEKINARLAQDIDSYRRPVFDAPDGVIRWVNQHDGTVWINIGRLDRLIRQTTFSVYDENATNVAKDEIKGKIEVTQILGDHLAEARITENELTNPIMPGDLIHTNIWSPGRAERFALTNGLDATGDGKSDIDMIRDLIASNGGIVDAYIDDSGKVHGEITVDTRYLVQGTTLTADSTQEELAARREIESKAKTLGLRTIGLQELLQRMGWKNEVSVTTYGRGGNSSQPFRTEDEIQKESGGNVSEFFRKRVPPRKDSKTAY